MSGLVIDVGCTSRVARKHSLNADIFAQATPYVHQFYCMYFDMAVESYTNPDGSIFLREE